MAGKKQTQKQNPTEIPSASKKEPVANDAKSAEVIAAASNTPKRGKKTKKSDVTVTPVKEMKTDSADRAAEEKADSAASAAPTEAKPKKTATKKPKAEKTAVEEKKPTTRTKTKTATKAASIEGTTRKKPGRKPSALSADKLCDMLKKKIDKNIVAGIDEKIAVDIVVWGIENEPDRRLYIEIKDKKAEVQPYSYDDKDLLVSVNYGDAMELLNGKLALRDAVISGKLTVQVTGNDGNILPALKLGSII